MKNLLHVLLALPLLVGCDNVILPIPDAKFKAYLVGNKDINRNGDKEIQLSEARTFNGTIDCFDLNISDLTGIEAFTALTYLYCSGNNLTSLNVSQNNALTILSCYDNQLTSLDVSKNTALTVLGCQSNQLTILDVSKNTALTYLYCTENQLTSLDVSQNTALMDLRCWGNNFDCEEFNYTVYDVDGE
jgi:Leucine-rich repeat (LRR) protein